MASVELLGAIFKGMIDAIAQLDPNILIKGIASLGMLAGIMYLLSGLVTMIPTAMVGIIGFGVLIAELSAVLIALGALYRIPGVKDILVDGGNLLQIVGTAIGQFVGGIIGGIGKGISASMPDIGKNLSEFMINLEPFISGSRLIDKSVLDGITILTAAMLEITAAKLYANLTKFITLGSSFAKLGTDLSEFMNNAKDFIAGANNIKPNSMKGFSLLADTIVKLTSANFLDAVAKWLPGKTSLASLEKN